MDVNPRILADLAVSAHLAFAVFVVVGGFIALRWPRLVWFHAPAALWGAFVELSGSVCPLTPLENALRVRAGSEPYPGDFLAHYVIGVLYPLGIDSDVQTWLGVGVIAVNAVAYTLVWRRAQIRPA